jgi:hypothetical protein
VCNKLDGEFDIREPQSKHDTALRLGYFHQSDAIPLKTCPDVETWLSDTHTKKLYVIVVDPGALRPARPAGAQRHITFLQHACLLWTQAAKTC